MATGYESKIDELVSAYPAMAETVVVGQSVEGREIRVHHLTAGSNKPQVALVVAQHAREWLAHTSGVYLMSYLLKRAGFERKANELMSNHEFVIVAIGNPDGYAYAVSTDRLWRKNRRNNGDGTFGVDPNRNWLHDWGEATGGSTTSSDTTYRGPSALSEPETSLIDTYLSGLPRLAGLIDVHSVSGDAGYEAYLAVPGDSVTQGNVPTAHANDFAAMRTAVKSAMESNGFGSWVYNDDPALSSNAGGVLRNHGYWSLGVPTLLFEAYADTGFEAPPSTIVPQGEDLIDGLKAFCDHFNFT